MKRRTMLAGSALLVPAVLSGCLSSGSDEREGAILTHVELGNATDDPQRFDLLVMHDDEIIHWATHEVEVATAEGEAGGAVIPIDSPDDSGHVEVYVRVGTEWQRTDFATDDYDDERVIAVVTYGMIEDEMLRISRRRSDRAASSDR